MDILAKYKEIRDEKARIVKALEALTGRPSAVCEGLLDEYALCWSRLHREYVFKLEDAITRYASYKTEVEKVRVENLRLDGENKVLRAELADARASRDDA